MTKQERQELFAALAAPFPESCIQRTEGRLTGRGYDTTGIGYIYVASRLNEVLGVGGFHVSRKLTVKEVTTAKGRPAFEATCELQMQLGEWIGGNFVPFAEAIGDGGHTATALADAIKGAFTNGFKKTAAFFGVGRQAYEGSLDDDNVPFQERFGTRRQDRAEQVDVGQERNRLTSRQLERIWSLAKEHNLDRTAFRRRVLDTHGRQLEYLSREEASVLIGKLMKTPEPGQRVSDAPTPKSGNGFDENAPAHGPGRR